MSNDHTHNIEEHSLDAGVPQPEQNYPNDNGPTVHTNSSTSEVGSKYKWTISHVGVAVVEATNDFQAMALGSAAFKLRDGGHKSKESFDLIYEFDSLSKTITADWGEDIPQAVELSTDKGAELYETAKEKTLTEAESSEPGADSRKVGLEIPINLNRPAEPKQFIFTETGNAISASELPDFDEKITSGEEDYWIVTALLYRRKLKTENKPIAYRNCANCGVTKHVFDAEETENRTLKTSNEGVWICLNCDDTTVASRPVSKSRKAERQPGSAAKYSIEEQERKHHREIMQKLEERGELESPQ